VRGRPDPRGEAHTQSLAIDLHEQQVSHQNPPVVPVQGIDLLLLTWAAGNMDALSYLASGVFTANMTGNTVVLGLALVGPDRSRLFPSIVTLSAFAVGVLMAAVVLLRRPGPERPVRDLKIGVGMELPFAIAFALLSSMSPRPAPDWTVPLGIALAACALGIQSVAVRRLRIAGVVTTFITGTITTAIVSFVQGSDPTPADGEHRRNVPGLLAIMFGVYIAAAAAGAALHSHHREIAAVIPVALLVVVSIRAAFGASERALPT
jgi:uncharacterized membrane protein YoaK (UPF0700 family)